MLSSLANILGYNLAYDAKEVNNNTIASLRPPEETPSIVFLIHGGNASLSNFPPLTVP